LFPNPSDGVFYADLSAWSGEETVIQVYNSRGQRVLYTHTRADEAPYPVILPAGTPVGLYFVELCSENGEKEVIRMVLER
jgi:hypothetical protein